jgi:hypothetical protein
VVCVFVVVCLGIVECGVVVGIVGGVVLLVVRWC